MYQAGWQTVGAKVLLLLLERVLVLGHVRLLGQQKFHISRSVGPLLKMFERATLSPS